MSVFPQKKHKKMAEYLKKISFHGIVMLQMVKKKI